jgi:hypothetical protein
VRDQNKKRENLLALRKKKGLMEKNKRKGGALSSCHFSLQDLVEKHMQINS